MLMTGFRIICCSKLEPQTPSKFSLLVVKIEASLDNQADRKGNLENHGSACCSSATPHQEEDGLCESRREGAGFLKEE